MGYGVEGFGLRIADSGASNWGAVSVLQGVLIRDGIRDEAVEAWMLQP